MSWWLFTAIVMLVFGALLGLFETAPNDILPPVGVIVGLYVHSVITDYLEARRNTLAPHCEPFDGN